MLDEQLSAKPYTVSPLFKETCSSGRWCLQQGKLRVRQGKPMRPQKTKPCHAKFALVLLVGVPEPSRGSRSNSGGQSTGKAGGWGGPAMGNSSSSTSGEVSAKLGWGCREPLPEKGSMTTTAARMAVGRTSRGTCRPEPRSQPQPPQAA